MTKTERIGDSAQFWRMPAEWAPHARCWMAWPCREATWGDRLVAARAGYAAVAHAIRAFEPVTMLARPQDAAAARGALGAEIEVLEMPLDDSWTRDSGPNFLLDGHGRLAGSTWHFNAWGGKYATCDEDAQMGTRILRHLGVAAIDSPLTAEGGAITVDGEGTVITTESCLLNANRNPGWSRREVEAELCRTLGCEKVLWIPGDPTERETDGHIDGLAAFARPGVVLCEAEPDPDSPRHALLAENAKALAAQTDARGRRLELVFIEEAWEAEPWGERFCLSYVNAYLANDAVIMPAYGVSGDQRAREVYARLYPERDIVAVPVTDIAVGGGGIHCITQQQPLT